MNERIAPSIPSSVDDYGFIVHEFDDRVVLACVRACMVKKDAQGRCDAEAWFMAVSIDDGTDEQGEANLAVMRQIAEIGR